MGTLPQLIDVPFRDDKAKCPVCHENIQFRAVVEIKSATARTVGGTNFRTNLSISITHEILRIESISHVCMYKEDES